MMNINRINYRSENILSIKELLPIIEELKKQNKKIGLCSGSFDLLHPGHLTHFEAAKKLCDVLVVGVALDDTSKSKNPGSGRPVFPHDIRAFMISKLKPVNFVILEAKALPTINMLKPDIFIKGKDYSSKEDPNLANEKNAVESIGGKIAFTETENLSTTEIIRHIKEMIN